MVCDHANELIWTKRTIFHLPDTDDAERTVNMCHAAFIDNGFPVENTPANARLITVAPEMLGELKAVVMIYGEKLSPNRLTEINAIIAKAEEIEK